MTVKMGSKRTSVKDAVKEVLDNKKAETEVQTEETPEVKAEEKTSARKSTKATTAKERPAAKRRLGGSRPSSRDPFWYLKHEGEYEMVTAEPFNEALGIKEIQVFDPSDAQWENGVVAVCTLIMDYVTIKGLQVRESGRDDSGAIYVTTQSRSWEKDGQKQYKNDVELSRVLQAQILSHVEAMLEPAE